MIDLPTPEVNPVDCYLRADRIPHIFCAGCGIGPAITCFVKALAKAKLDLDKTVVVSGIGCTGRVAGYVKLDSFHTTHGRALPFATGLKLANPALNVVVFSGDGDLVSIGGNHLIHSARRNVEITVVCLNNFNYGMTGGQVGPTTPMDARTNTTPYGNYDYPFNLPLLMAASGAIYVARWTTIHLREMEASMAEALLKRGFSFVEVLGPCPTAYGRLNKLPTGLDEMKMYREKSIVRNGADPREVDISLDGTIMVGKFVDIERPSYLEARRKTLDRAREQKSL